jgi:hypothetical protein
MAVFAAVHGSMAGPTAYTRLAEELHCRGHRALLVELPVDLVSRRPVPGAMPAGGVPVGP